MFFLHIGLPKTGTSFLQNQIFPRWNDIHYIRYSNLESLVAAKGDENYLISKESLAGNILRARCLDGDLLEEKHRSIKNLSSFFPDARVIIGFRRHNSFIISMYKQYLHGGGTLPLSDFFSIRENDGFLSKEDFLFRPIVGFVSEYFQHAPFIYTQEELRDDLPNFLSDLQGYMGGTPPSVDEIKFHLRNKGVGYYQGALLRYINRFSHSQFNPDGLLPLTNKYTMHLRIDPRRICQEWLAFVSDRPIRFSEQQNQEVLNYYAEDWSFIQDLAKNR